MAIIFCYVKYLHLISIYNAEEGESTLKRRQIEQQILNASLGHKRSDFYSPFEGICNAPI